MHKKSYFGAVTFGERVVCSFMFKNLSKLKSGKECDGFCYTRKWSWLLTLKHFVFSSLYENMITY